MITVKSKRAVKPFRKVLSHRLQDNRATLVVFGESNKKKWFLGVRINDTVHIYSTRYISMAAAIMHGHRRFHVEAVRCPVKVAA